MAERSVTRRLIAAAIGLTMCGTLIAASMTTASGAVPLSDALIRKALAARNGDVVRRSPNLRVTRVTVRHGGQKVGLFVVRLGGRFPPRALRYVVTAGGERIGHGIPVANGSAIRAVTRDRSVLTERLAARYSVRATGVAATGPSSGDTRVSIEDPATPGPFEVTTTGYDLGDQVFQPTDIGAKVELVGEVYHPVELAAGPYPLVVFLHGNHSTCFRGRQARFWWPCRTGWEPIPNHEGYAYIAERLASHGFVVASVSANGVNVLGSRLRDTGMRQRGELIDAHLELWERWSTTGGDPFGTSFVGAVDMTRIGTMGHSRGGEGVVWHKRVDDARPDPFGVDAVLALAPVDFTRSRINNVDFATFLPECDGDVSDLQGVHFFDDSRYNVPGDTGAKHTVTLFGANHNFFNTVWSPSSGFPGTFDDGEFSRCFDERLRERRQRRIGRSYVVGFFRRYLAGDTASDPMWTGAGLPGFMEPDEVTVSYLAPDSPTRRRDIARFTDAVDLARNEQGGEMEPEALARYEWCAGSSAEPCYEGPDRWLDRHLPGLARATITWRSHAGELGATLPVGARDVSGYDAFQFRALVPPGYGANRGVRFQDLSIALIDGGGNEATVAASEVGNDALVVARRFFASHLLMQQVRFPLDRFAGVDLTDVREVEIRFDRMRSGAFQIADANFSRGG